MPVSLLYCNGSSFSKDVDKAKVGPCEMDTESGGGGDSEGLKCQFLECQWFASHEKAKVVKDPMISTMEWNHRI